MKRAKKLSTGFIFLGLMFLGFHGPAFAADADKCTAITAVPFTITTAGSYCLTQNIATPGTFTAGNAITVSTNDVVIDLGGYTLGNLAAGSATQAVGIYALDENNITIQNGTVRGFCRGIDLLDSGTVAPVASRGDLVENVRVDTSRCIGIVVESTGGVIRDNQVLHTSTPDGGIGIYAVGSGVRVLNNLVSDTGGTNRHAPSFGIYIDPFGNGAVVEGNSISNPTTVGDAFGAVGVFIKATDVLVVNNRFTTLDYGIEFYGGTGKYRDNLTSTAFTQYRFVGGTDAGNNN